MGNSSSILTKLLHERDDVGRPNIFVHLERADFGVRDAQFPMDAGTVLADDEGPIDHGPLGIRPSAVRAHANRSVLADGLQNSGGEREKVKFLLFVFRIDVFSAQGVQNYWR